MNHHKIKAAAVMEGKAQSLADKIVAILSDPERVNGVESRTKRSQMDNGKFKKSTAKQCTMATPALTPIIPLPNTAFKVTSKSFPKNENEKK